jgi:hypothetical protein
MATLKRAIETTTFIRSYFKVRMSQKLKKRGERERDRKRAL